MAGDDNLNARTLGLCVHELRTPMSVVQGYLRLLLREQTGPLTDQQRRMVEEADRACTRIGTIVGDMSDLGRLDAGEVTLARQEVDVAAVLEQQATHIADGKDRGVTLEVRRPPEPVVVIGDASRLRTAIKAVLRATVRERPEPGVIVAGCTVADGHALITIGDPAALPALGASSEVPFDQWPGGLGLALAVTHRVILAHGGTIWSAAGDRPRAGTGIRLPLQPAS